MTHSNAEQTVMLGSTALNYGSHYSWPGQELTYEDEKVNVKRSYIIQIETFSAVKLIFWPAMELASWIIPFACINLISFLLVCNSLDLLNMQVASILTYIKEIVSSDAEIFLAYLHRLVVENVYWVLNFFIISLKKFCERLLGYLIGCSLLWSNFT